MILCKGEKVIFTMEEGRPIRLPASYGILHDTKGERFSKCAAIVGPVRRTQVSVFGGKIATAHYDQLRAAREYFGPNSTYDLRFIAIPRIPAMDTFREIGAVTQIDYVRRGKYKGLYYHPFKLGTHPMLSKSGRWYRLELGSGCMWNDRGFVFP